MFQTWPTTSLFPRSSKLALNGHMTQVGPRRINTETSGGTLEKVLLFTIEGSQASEVNAEFPGPSLLLQGKLVYKQTNTKLHPRDFWRWGDASAHPDPAI